jgi:hypothetical protein
MKNYIGGTKVNQAGFPKKCAMCKKIFTCQNECGIRERITNMDQCDCPSCAQRYDHYPEGSPAYCRTRFPERHPR